MASCCETESETEVPECCPRCGTKGKRVARVTVAAMADVDVAASVLSRSEFSLCPSASCEAVYFAGREEVLEKGDLRVPVYWKDAGADVPLCYCFSHTRRSIADEIAATGRSSAFAAITAAVKAGECACDVKNPSGTCCLGDVRTYERALLASVDPDAHRKGARHDEAG